MSNNTIQIKRTTGTNPPATIADGELAHAQDGNKLYIGVGGSNTPVQVGGDLSGFATTAGTYDTTTLDAALNGKSDSTHTHDYTGVFSALGHTHDYSGTYSPLSHTHTDYYTKTHVDNTFAPKTAPSFTGAVTISGTGSSLNAPNPGVSEDSTVVATTSWVQTKVDAVAAGAPNLDNAALTGVPVAPTAAVATNTTQVATTAFVAAAVSALINGAPGALDTLNELAAAFGDDADFITTMTNGLAAKMDLDGSTIDGGTYT